MRLFIENLREPLFAMVFIICVLACVEFVEIVYAP